MKLNLLFIVMDVLTLLVYPFVFVHSKLRELFKSNAGFTPANLLMAGAVTSDG